VIYLQLFWSFFQVGLFSIGGGYAALPQIQNQVVDVHHWLSISEFADILTISQMTPGPIAINAATFVGIKMAGIPGAVLATFGNVFPSCVIVLILAFLYAKYKSFKGVEGVLGGLRPAVVGMIASASLAVLLLALFKDGVIPDSMAGVNLFNFAMLAVCFLILRIFKPNPIYVMAGAGAAGVGWYFLEKLITVAG